MRVRGVRPGCSQREQQGQDREGLERERTGSCCQGKEPDERKRVKIQVEG